MSHNKTLNSHASQETICSLGRFNAHHTTRSNVAIVDLNLNRSKSRVRLALVLVPFELMSLGLSPA